MSGGSPRQALHRGWCCGAPPSTPDGRGFGGLTGLVGRCAVAAYYVAATATALWLPALVSLLAWSVAVAPTHDFQ